MQRMNKSRICGFGLMIKFANNKDFSLLLTSTRLVVVVYSDLASKIKRCPSPSQRLSTGCNIGK